MTTDRDLIELAARAMGRTVAEWMTFESHGNGAAVVARLDDGTYFAPLHVNPMTDCMGDALRLAVRLKIDIVHDDGIDDAWVLAGNLDGVEDVPDESMRDAATRRAITRAAAEIARAQAEGVR